MQQRRRAKSPRQLLTAAHLDVAQNSHKFRVAWTMTGLLADFPAQKFTSNAAGVSVGDRSRSPKDAT